MILIHVLSLLILLASVGLAGGLYWRNANRGMGFLAVLLLLLLISQSVWVWGWAWDAEGGTWLAVPELLVSLLAAATLWVAGRFLEDYRQTVHKLQQSQAQAAEVQRIARLGSWDWDLRTQEIVWSDQMYELFGMSRDEPPLAAEQFLEFIPPEDRQQIKQRIEELVAHGGSVDYELRICPRDGEIRVVQGQGHVLLDEAGQPIRLLGTLLDITDRVEARKALSQSVSLYHSLVDSLPVYVFRKDLAGRFSFVNRAFAELVGRPASQIVGCFDSDFNPPHLVEDYRADDLQVALTCEPLDKVEENMNLGVNRLVRVIKTPLFDSAGEVEGVQGIFWDVTELEMAQRELQQSVARFRLLAENIPGVIYLYSHQEELRYPLLFLNEAVQRLTGWPRLEFLAGRVRLPELIHPEDRQNVIDAVTSALARQQPYQVQYRLMHRSGEVRWVDDFGAGVVEAGKINTVEGIMFDITDHREARDERLRALERISRQQSLILQLATSPQLLQHNLRVAALEVARVSSQGLDVDRVGIWLFDRERTRLECLTHYDRTAGELSLPAISVQDAPDYFQAIDSDRALTAVDARTDPRTRELAEGYLQPNNITSMLDAVIRIQGKCVGVVCHEHRGRPLRKWTADETVFAGAIADQVAQLLLEQKRREAEQETYLAQEKLLEQRERENERVAAELERVKDELVKSTRFITVGKMSAQIAHDLRNPLQGIQYTIDFLRRVLVKEDGEPLFRDQLKLIQDEVQVCRHIINNLLDVTQARSARCEVVPLGDLMQNIQNRLVIPAGVQFSWNADPQPFPLWVDPVQFSRVLDNLLKNALDAVESTGQVKLEARLVRQGVEILVADTGKGIPAADRSQIFDLFFTTKARGTGLGLTTCRQIVEGHQGTLDLLTSGPGGTVFRILLPSQPAELTDQVAASSTSASS